MQKTGGEARPIAQNVVVKPRLKFSELRLMAERMSPLSELKVEIKEYLGLPESKSDDE
jgi:hypothetical protein